MKKIYFACSIRGGRADQPIYQEIANIIKTKAELLSEVFSDKSLTSQGHIDMTDSEIWKRDLDWLKSADGVIAEVTNPSLGVGYEIAKAEQWNIKTLILYRPQAGKRLSAMIAGSLGVKVIEYKTPTELRQVIEDFIASL